MFLILTVAVMTATEGILKTDHRNQNRGMEEKAKHTATEYIARRPEENTTQNAGIPGWKLNTPRRVHSIGVCGRTDRVGVL